jgi:electron transport complex protein RnfD
MSDMLLVSSSPHIRSNESTERIMRDVVIALLPATFFGFYNFGLQAFLVTIVSILVCMGTEAGFQFLTKQRITINDYSAVITGLLLALNVPHTLPLWMVAIGAFFAIFVIKQLFGGLGQNFMNPALGARAFLLVSFAEPMTKWVLDDMATATPLEILKNGGDLPALSQVFFGHIAGSLGETSVLALLIGGAYLLARKVISWRIPAFYIGTVFVLMALLGGHGLDMNYLGYQIFSGGLILGAFFMATDYASSPVTPLGQIIFAIGIGVITVVIRLYGGYPEGVSFAILFMNLWVPIIERYTVPKAFGEGVSYGAK